MAEEKDILATNKVPITSNTGLKNDGPQPRMSKTYYVAVKEEGSRNMSSMQNITVECNHNGRLTYYTTDTQRFVYLLNGTQQYLWTFDIAYDESTGRPPKFRVLNKNNQYVESNETYQVLETRFNAVQNTTAATLLYVKAKADMQFNIGATGSTSASIRYDIKKSDNIVYSGSVSRDAREFTVPKMSVVPNDSFDLYFPDLAGSQKVDTLTYIGYNANNHTICNKIRIPASNKTVLRVKVFKNGSEMNINDVGNITLTVSNSFTQKTETVTYIDSNYIWNEQLSGPVVSGIDYGNSPFHILSYNVSFSKLSMHKVDRVEIINEVDIEKGKDIRERMCEKDGGYGVQTVNIYVSEILPEPYKIANWLGLWKKSKLEFRYNSGNGIYRTLNFPPLSTDKYQDGTQVYENQLECPSPVDEIEKCPTLSEANNKVIDATEYKGGRNVKCLTYADKVNNNRCIRYDKLSVVDGDSIIFFLGKKEPSSTEIQFSAQWYNPYKSLETRTIDNSKFKKPIYIPQVSDNKLFINPSTIKILSNGTWKRPYSITFDNMNHPDEGIAIYETDTNQKEFKLVNDNNNSIMITKIQVDKPKTSLIFKVYSDNGNNTTDFSDGSDDYLTFYIKEERINGTSSVYTYNVTPGEKVFSLISEHGTKYYIIKMSGNNTGFGWSNMAEGYGTASGYNLNGTYYDFPIGSPDGSSKYGWPPIELKYGIENIFIVTDNTHNYDVEFKNKSNYNLGIDINENAQNLLLFNSETSGGWTLGSNSSLSVNRTAGNTYSFSPDATIWYGTNAGECDHSTTITGKQVWVNFQSDTNKHYLSEDIGEPFEFDTNNGFGPYVIEINTDYKI